MRGIINRTIEYLIRVIFAGIIAYLLVSSFLFTGVTDATEKTVIYRDKFGFNLIAVLLLVGIYFIFRKNATVKSVISKINDSKKLYTLILSAFLVIIFMEGCLFFLALRKVPVADQSMVCVIAEQWIAGDYSSFYVSYYLDRSPNQIGLVSFLYFLIKIFGAKYQTVFQLLNVISIVVMYKSFADLGKLAKLNNVSCLSAVFMGILFLPIVFYSTFRYGTLIGLCLSVLAFKYLCKYLNSNKWYYLIIVVIAQFWAASVKNNYLIYMIALIVYILICLIKKFDIKLLATGLALIILLFTTTSICGAVAKKITGMPAPKSLSSLAWVAMGLHDNDSLADGWFDGYVNATYFDNNCDKDIHKEIVRNDVKERLKEFMANPIMAIKFFNSKNTSQWNNVDFQSTCINGQMPSKTDSGTKISEKLSQHINVYTEYCNVLHFLILAATAVYIIAVRNKSNYTLYYLVCMIGGFIFHTFWEAKGQYTLTYFVLLIGLIPWVVNFLFEYGKKENVK